MAEPDEYEGQSLLDRFGGGQNEPSRAVVQANVAGMPAQRVGAMRIEIPRDERKVKDKLRIAAQIAGEKYYYRWPVKDRKANKTNWVEGPTIKCANAVARMFGNCDVETRVTDLGTHFLIYGRYTDYETGFSLTRPFQQRKSQRTMGDDAERQQDIALQIGVSKAIRNVIVNALEEFADYAVEEAMKSQTSEIGKNLNHERDRTVKRLGELDVDLKRVEAVIGRPAREWNATDVAQVIASMRGVIDKMTELDDVFPPLEKPEPEPPKVGKLDEFVEGQKLTPSTPAATPASKSESR